MNKSSFSRAFFLAATFLYWICLYLYVPTLSTYVKTRTSDLAVVGMVLAMYGLWQAFVRIPLGIAVDKRGRSKAFIFFGILTASTGALVMGLGRSVGTLTIGRSLTGLAAGTWVPLTAAFSGLFPPEQAVFATTLLTFSGSVGRLIATSANGFLNNIGGYPLAFILAAAAGVAGAGAILFWKDEGRRSSGVSIRSILALFKRYDVMLPSLVSLVLQMGTWAVTFGFLPILAEGMGANDVVLSLLVSLNVAALILGNLLAAAVVKKVRLIPLLVAYAIVFVSGMVVLAASHSEALLFVGTAIMGLANGVGYPTLMGMSIRQVDQSHRTGAMGIHQSVYAIGMFGGPWLGGIVAQAAGIRSMFLATGAFVLSVSFALLLVYHRFSRGAVLAAQKTEAGQR